MLVSHACTTHSKYYDHTHCSDSRICMCADARTSCLQTYLEKQEKERRRLEEGAAFDDLMETASAVASAMKGENKSKKAAKKAKHAVSPTRPHLDEEAGGTRAPRQFDRGSTRFFAAPPAATTPNWEDEGHHEDDGGGAAPIGQAAAAKAPMALKEGRRLSVRDYAMLSRQSTRQVITPQISPVRQQMIDLGLSHVDDYRKRMVDEMKTQDDFLACTIAFLQCVAACSSTHTPAIYLLCSLPSAFAGPWQAWTAATLPAASLTETCPMSMCVRACVPATSSTETATT